MKLITFIDALAEMRLSESGFERKQRRYLVDNKNNDSTILLNILTPGLSTALKQMLSPELRVAIQKGTILEKSISPQLRVAIEKGSLLEKSISPQLRAAIQKGSLLERSISPELRGAFNHIAEMQSKLISPELGNSLDKVLLKHSNLKQLSNVLSKAVKMNSSPVSPILNEVSCRLQEITQNLKNEKFDINADGTISATDKTFSISDVQTVIDSYIESKCSSSTEISLENNIYDLFNLFSRQHPVISRILLWIVIPIIISLFANSLTSQPKVIVNENKTVVMKFVKNVVQLANPDKEFYTQYRIVVADRLHVRASNSIRSRQLGVLEFGQIVRVVGKKKNWIQIECENENGEIWAKGWVFTRYVKRIK